MLRNKPPPIRVPMLTAVDPRALFLGPQGQNAEVLERALLEALRDHVYWRRSLCADDPDAFDPADESGPGFMGTQTAFRAAMRRLLARMKDSVPAYSPRYLGAMIGNSLLPAQAGFLAAMLYNPNNVAGEGSKVTAQLESEIAQDLARMLGYDPSRAWGHLCSCGTVANIEALWILRNLALTPLRLPRSGGPPDLKDAAGQALQGVSPDKCLGRLDGEALLALHHALPRSVGAVRKAGAFRVLVSAGAHASWRKAADLLGFGEDRLEALPMDAGLRMDLDALDARLEALAAEGQPVLAVVATLGTVQGGGVDPLEGILELRKRYAERHGRWFFVHLDAAFGGYARSVFLDSGDRFRSQAGMLEILALRPGFHAAMEAAPGADSITVDPHTLGFIPYPAGALVLRDGDMRLATDCCSHCAEESGAADPPCLGLMEGSRPGAAAGAVWLAHRTVPLNDHGYGAILGESLRCAREFAEHLDNRSFGDYVCRVLEAPDLNVVLYAFGHTGPSTLHRVNALNEMVFSQFPPSLEGGFALASTTLTRETHGLAPLPFLRRLGVPAKAWRAGSELLVLRSVMGSPFHAEPETRTSFRAGFIRALEALLGPGGPGGAP